MLKYGLRRSDNILKENKIGNQEQKYYSNEQSLSNFYSNKNSNFSSLDNPSSFRKFINGDNHKKPYSREKLYELKKNKGRNMRYKNNSIFNSQINFDSNNQENSKNFKNNNFLKNKDPNETLYKNSTLISNSYNILNNNLFNNFSSSKNTDHVSDLLNYGSREQLYNYIGKKGFLYSNQLNRNYDSRNLIKEVISKDELTEYYKNNCWSVAEYAYKEEANSKYREYMEDKAKSIDGFNGDNNIGIFCIFDGHGGKEVSTYLQKNILTYFKEFLSENDNIENNLINLFRMVDENFNSEYYNKLGSTACIVYITKENGKKYFYSANIGDTRCVFVQKNRAKRISYDDRATDQNESDRVKRDGGIIFRGRVYGQLMLTRAFGDYELKNYGVICTPHVYKEEITIDDKYIIIASDGVWDVLNEDEIYSYSLISKNSKDLCDIIVKNSIDKGSMDNISCFVIGLN